MFIVFDDSSTDWNEIGLTVRNDKDKDENLLLW